MILTPNGATLSPTIHLIDDDAAVRESLALLIGTVGLRVTPWADPQAFLSGFDREGIGAIVLDVRMPGISGLSVLDTLRAQRLQGHMALTEADQLLDLAAQTMRGEALKVAGEPGLILDVACGAGRYWPVLAEHGNRVILAADPSQDMLNHAQTHHPASLLQRVKNEGCS